ncbi:hypothetical protein St703_23950 [Sporolactobacillus terrae]|uniref:Uncharacterized protein n=1 Tax=Sporolactobacillus terrae TaxID=269673 RepID=A0A5K7X4Q7_9BACL|nr:hypothetical protein St703_23950 [Sporolactobacillus terrae]
MQKELSLIVRGTSAKGMHILCTTQKAPHPEEVRKRGTPAGVQAKGDPADKLRVRGGSWTARGKRAAEVSFKYIVGE